MIALFATVIILIVLIIHYYKNNTIYENNTSKKISNKLEVWLYLDTEDKYWSNFSNKTKNIPDYLLLCLKTIFQNSGKNVNIITNHNVTKYLSNIDTKILNDKTVPSIYKNYYISTAILYTYGGIWLVPNMILFKNIDYIETKLQEFNFVAFGCSNNKYMCNNNHLSPNLGVFASQKGNPLMKHCFTKINEYFNDNINYNYEFQNDIKNIILDELKHMVNNNIIKYYQIDSYHNGKRDSKNKLIKVDNLLSTNNTVFRYEPVFVLIDRDELDKNSIYSWFNNMNKEQIINSNLWISSLFRKALQKTQELEDYNKLPEDTNKYFYFPNESVTKQAVHNK